MIDKKVKRIIKETIHSDRIYFKKDGTVEFLQGYFYTHGNDEDKMAEGIKKRLAEKGINIEIVKTWNHWASFRGRASVRASSHWGVIVRVISDNKK